MEDLIRGLTTKLTRIDNKTVLKSKSINLIYNISRCEMAHRCCRLVEAIFTMNWESVREREKGMKKLVERFVAWVIYWALLAIVFVEDQPKLEKMISEGSSA